MIEDRYYMRETPFEPKRSATIVLLIVNVVAFVLECCFYNYPPRLRQPDYLALSAEGIRHGYIWELLTFQFLHANLWHLIGNCWGLYMFGRQLEETLGKSRFLVLYFSSGVLGGLVQAGLGFIFPDGQFAAPVVGASAGVFGLVAAYAYLYPEQPLVFLIFFVIPVSLRAKYLLFFEVLLAVFGMIFPVGNFANAAHLGGIAAGLLFVRYAIHWQWHWPRFARVRSRPSGPSMALRPEKGVSKSLAADLADGSLRSDDFVSREVDPILDKISAHGIHSLTERERRILENARARMARR